MANSSLLGIEPTPPRAPGHDDLSLGPSDSSDSGSDMTGLDSPDAADPQLPLDWALGDDSGRPLAGPDMRGGSTDSAGTGERRSAAGDAGGREAADIAIDRVFHPFGDDPDPPAPEDVAARAAASPGNDDEDEEEEDEDDGAPENEAADPVGDGHSDADLAASLPPRPGHPNPEPDLPTPEVPVPTDSGPATPEDDSSRQQPGRDPALRRA